MLQVQRFLVLQISTQLELRKLVKVALWMIPYQEAVVIPIVYEKHSIACEGILTEQLDQIIGQREFH